LILLIFFHNFSITIPHRFHFVFTMEYPSYQKFLRFFLSTTFQFLIHNHIDFVTGMFPFQFHSISIPFHQNLFPLDFS
jgi:hypothetical protein